jgi:hypothetical protein
MHAILLKSNDYKDDEETNKWHGMVSFHKRQALWRNPYVLVRLDGNVEQYNGMLGTTKK